MRQRLPRCLTNTTDFSEQDWSSTGWSDRDWSANSWWEQSTERPQTTERPQSRNHRGTRSAAATARRIARGEDRRRAAEQAAEAAAPEAAQQQAESKGQAEQWLGQESAAPPAAEVKTEPVAPAPAAEEKKEEPVTPATETSVPEPSPETDKKEEVPTTEVRDNPRVVLAERVVRADPTPGPPALEASEVAPVGLVPRSERQRPRRVSRTLASVPESGKLRPQVPSAELIADARAAKRILDGEEDPDWGSSSSVSSYDLPKLDSEDEADYVIADPVPNTESLQSASVQTADWEKPDTPRSAGALLGL